MRIVGLVIAWVVAIGIIGIGIAYVAKSERNAAAFGLPRLPERDSRSWWQIKEVRDIVSGLLVIVAIFAAGADLCWLILVLSLNHRCSTPCPWLRPAIELLNRQRPKKRLPGLNRSACGPP
jgi:hypothetical protein